MQGLGGLLCLATVAIEALLSVMAAALSGFGLFFRVSFRWGHDDLLRIVMSSIPTYMKETMSHLASISKRQTRGEDAPAPPSYKPFMMNGFHGVSSENPHQCLLKFMFGKARPVSARPRRNPPTRSVNVSWDWLLRNPMTGIAGCALVASGATRRARASVATSPR